MREWLWRLALACVPRAFRAQFGEEILETARTLGQTRRSSVIETAATITDAVTTIYGVCRDVRREAWRLDASDPKFEF
jgi:hypothetical protein